MKPARAAGIAAISIGGITMAPVFLAGAVGPQLMAVLPGGATTLGSSVGGFFLVTTAGSAAAGRLIDRWGGMRAFRLALTLAAISGVLAAGLPLTVAGFAAALGLAGAANALAGPVSSSLIANFVVDRPSMAFGLKQSAVPAGALVSGLAGAAVSTGPSWRAVFLVAPLLAAGLLMVTRGVHPTPAERSIVRRRGSIPKRSLLRVAAAMAAIGAVATSLSSFVTDLAMIRGFSATGAGLLLAGMSAAAICTRLVLGVVGDRRGFRVFRLAGLMLVAGAVGCVLLIFPARSSMLVGAMFVYGIGWGWTGASAHAVVRLHPSGPGVAAGLVQAGAAAGGISGPPLIGAVIDRATHGAAWGVGALICLLGALAIGSMADPALAREMPSS